MDRKQLFGEVLKKESRAQRKRQKQAARMAIKANNEAVAKQAEEDASKQRVDAFKQLSERNREVIMAVKDVVHEKGTGNEWNVNDRGRRYATERGIVVRLDSAPVTQATPNHVAVCLVTYRTMFPQSNDYDNHLANFEFAFIPKDTFRSVTEASGYPFGVISQDEILKRGEKTFKAPVKNYGADTLTQQGREANALYPKSWQYRHEYSEKLAQSTAVVEAAEKNLAWILEAAADPILNPHLNQSSQAVNLSKPE